MCLAVPGKLLEIIGDDPFTRTGKISFGGSIKEINLAFVPEVKIGEYLLVHAGVAISIVDEEEAKRVFDYITEIDQLDDSEEPQS
jgi:hydrogenase expression/formation protein HypC